MASNTERFGLLKKDPIADGADTFNIQTMLNDNWDKMDGAAKKTELDAHLADYVKHPAFVVASGTANIYEVTLNPAPTEYVDGMGVIVAINLDATGVSTINVNGLGAKPIKKANGNDVTNLKANGVYTLRYNATTSNFILQGEGGEYGTVQAPQVLEGYTFGTEDGVIEGTMPNRGVFNLPLGATVPAGYYSGGTAPNGKRWASGTAVSSVGRLKFTYTTGVLSDGTFYTVEVAGLTFEPSLLILKTNNSMSIYEGNSVADYYSKTVKTFNFDENEGSYHPHNIKADVSPAYVNNSGFLLPMYDFSGSKTIEWIAYE